jgi:intein-encoded DNA endonuclease-like protein
VNEATAAYIAGFLDGDGSIHFQLVRQQQYRYGFYVRLSVSFHQHQTGREGLEWLKGQLEVGYIRNRAGQMSDYVITSRPAIRILLNRIEAYVVFKRRQVRQALELLDMIEAIDSSEEFLAVAQQVEMFKSLNRSKRRINTVQSVLQAWREMDPLAPVTTDPEKGEILAIDCQDHTPAPRKRVEI